MEKLSLIFISWAVGYGGMWAGKWLVSVLFGYSDVITSVIGSIMTRTSTVDGYGREFKYAELFKAICSHFDSPLARFGIIYAFFAIIYRLASPGRDKYPKSYWLPLAVQALLPFLWYLALSNHSYVHNFFTYRTLSVSIFSLLCIVPGCCKADVSGDIRLLKQGGRTAAVVLSSIAIGFAALLAVYVIPTDNMEKHLSESVETFQREGSGPVSDIMGVETRLDNYTDALMLLSAAYSGDESIIDKSINVYRYSLSPGEDTVVSLISCYGEGTAAVTVAFERFWHGYLLFLKPALWMMNYGQIRLVNAALLAICTGFLIIAMIRKGLRGYIIPYILSILLIDPFAIARSIQYSTVYYVATLASLYMLIKLDAFNDSKCKLYMFFTAVGCATSFFDLLTWPLATFGLPSIIMICTDKAETKAKIRMLIQSLAWWFTGYIGVWAGKWILATIIGGNNIVLDAVKTALFRSPIKDNGGFPLSLFEVIGDNLRHFIAPAGAAFILYILFTLFKRFSKNKEDELKADIACNGLPLVFLALIPFVWYGFLGNHSYVYHWFTYREMAVSAFALLSILPVPLSIKPKQKT